MDRGADRMDDTECMVDMRCVDSGKCVDEDVLRVRLSQRVLQLVSRCPDPHGGVVHLLIQVFFDMIGISGYWSRGFLHRR